MALHPNLRHTAGIACSLVALTFVLKHSDSKGLSLISWIGGGSLLVGGYKVVVEAVDFLDQLADQLYWNRRKTL